MLQVDLDQGILDFDRFCVEYFTDKYKIYGIGNIISNTSLFQFLTECSDFLRRITLKVKSEIA